LIIDADDYAIIAIDITLTLLLLLLLADAITLMTLFTPLILMPFHYFR
jgi:hypothetical protein